MKFVKMMCGLAAVAATGASAQDAEVSPTGGSASFGSWRLTVGPSVNLGVRAKFRVNAAALAPRATGFTPSVGKTQAEALADANAGRYDGGAFVNPDSSVELDNRTWNWWAPESAYSRGTLTFRNAFDGGSAATEIHNVSTRDEHDVPGVTVELARNLVHDGEAGWGLDLSVLASYFRRDDLLKAGGTCYTRTESEGNGAYVTEYGAGQMQLTDRSRNPSGGYGAGTYGGPGPLVDLTTKNFYLVPGAPGKTTKGSIEAEGDYEEFEFALVARPYCDVFGWLRAYATVGVAASYARLSYKSSVLADGARVSRGSHTYDDWDVCGLVGLGLMATYDRYSVGLDVMRRLWADPLTFDADAVRGSVNRGDWLVRLSFGVSF